MTELRKTLNPLIVCLTSYLVTILCSVALCDVAYAKPLIITAPKSGSHQSTGESVNPDYLMANEWWVKKYKLSKLWTKATGRNVVIASCDSGFYTQADDLQGQLLTDYARDFSNSWDYDIISNGSYVPQGTASAGIMVGKKNFQGINGIAFNAKLVPLQNFHYTKKLDEFSLEQATTRCIQYAITVPNVSVILVQAHPLNSKGSIETIPAIRSAITQAISSGITVVVPAGDHTRELHTERIYDTSSIIVGAVTANQKSAIFSNYGARTTIAAYGEKIKALWGPYGETMYFGGTLAASAQVAAFVALAQEVNPRLLPQDVKWLIKQTRNRTSDNYSVGGIIDPIKFIEAAKLYKPDTILRKRAEAYRKIITEEIKANSWAQ